MHRFLLTFLLTATSAPAVTIVVDYSYDNGYFGFGTAARTAIESAAHTLSARLADGQLATLGTRTATGSATWTNSDGLGLTTIASLSASYTINNPSTGDFTRLAKETWIADEIRIYVGLRQFGSGSSIAKGRPADVAITTLGVGYVPSWNDAVNAAAGNATALFQRGDIRNSTINGSLTYSGPTGGFNATGPFSIGIGPTAGAVWFDGTVKWDTSRGLWGMGFDGVTAGDEYSLESVALRELIRAIGTDPASQVGIGQQAGLTEADIQALQNSGWITTQIPEPSVALLTLAGIPFALRRRR
ncbi:hypothetical protein JIN84_09035 [Luteolibacter yonseiensis]|uniref:PEP-CTERM protein-sorting domain-containing protein n=1 Tax=Luteolibacter yonseiensis TaxID=1144680 RepID=A0A934R5D0_9BACT|nr:hypothetical protein [Luteolibacter yonseiensis]MBK1815760.1 hypothetical protein [Luteolibacter yonseiensis]